MLLGLFHWRSSIPPEQRRRTLIDVVSLVVLGLVSSAGGGAAFTVIVCRVVSSLSLSLGTALLLGRLRGAGSDV